MAVVIESGDCTQSGNNTAQATWAVSHPAASTGDLLVFCIAWDDSVTTTDCAEPAGPNGETLTEMNATALIIANAGGVSIRMKAWYTVATGSWSASTVTFTPTATEQWTATVIRVPVGEVDASTPIGAIQTLAGTSETDTQATSPSFSAGSSDGGGCLVWFAGVNSDALSTSPSTGWTAIANQDLGAVTHGIAVRDAAVTNSESFAQATWDFATDFSDSFGSIAFVVRAGSGGGGGSVNPDVRNFGPQGFLKTLLTM